MGVAGGGGADGGEDARPDDGPDAQGDEVERPQGALELVPLLPGLRDQLVEALRLEELTQGHAGT